MNWSFAVRGLCVAIAVGALIGGCHSGTVSVPILGQLSNGWAAAGEATTRADGQGTLWVQVPRRFRCEGSYNALNAGASMVIPITCSNGRRGEVVAAIQFDRLSGTAIAQLDNGLRGQFVFGNLNFEQAFGSRFKAGTKAP